MTKISYKLIAVWVLSIALLIGGIATTIGTITQRGVFLRGWTDATDSLQSANIPYRLPLAGVNVDLRQYDSTLLDTELKNITAAGFTWVRQSFDWPDIEPEQGQLDFSTYDPIVAAVSKYPSLRIVAVLNGSPTWARRTEASDRITAPPASMAAFGKFAGELASRYADSIDYYQIWDEPNLNTQWGGLDPRPADYAAMLTASYTAIHGSDQTAMVIAAALAPTVETGPRNISDVFYLRDLYELKANNSFDAAAGKPYGFDSGPEDRVTRDDTLNFSHIILLREVMVRNGDGNKPLWGSNFGWNYLPDDWSGPPSIWGKVDGETQKRFTRAAYLRAAREWSWMGGLILEHWHPNAPADDPIRGFAVDWTAANWFDSGNFFTESLPTIGLYSATDSRFNYEGQWRFGPLGADVQHTGSTEALADGSEHKLTFTFEGSSVAFLLRRANYVAYAYVLIDGKPANNLPVSPDNTGYILLKSPDLESHTDLITVAHDLAPGPHTVEARFYLGYERWALAGISIGNPPDIRRYDFLMVAGIVAAVIGLAGTLLTGRKLLPLLPAGNLGGIVAYLRQMLDVIAGLIVSLLAVLGMAMTWNGVLPEIVKRDAPTVALTILTAGLVYFSPAFIFTVVAIIILWLLIYNRPFVGLVLIIFWSPFFLAPVQLYIWAIPMVELCLILTLSAALVRVLIQRRFRLSGASVKPMDWAMLTLALLATVTLFWSEQRAPALRLWRIVVVEPALYYLLIRTTRLTRNELIRLVDVFIFVGGLIAAMGLIGYVTGGQSVVIAESGARRLAGVYGSYASPNNLALFLGRVFPFAFAMLLLAPNTLRRLVAGGLLVLMGIAILLTQSGGAILLGIPAATICVLILWGRRGRVLAGALVGTMVLAIPLSRFIPRLQNVLDLTRSSSFIRTQVWSSATNLLKERPLTGAGLDQFLYLYRSRYILPEAWREPDLSHPHNFILDYWISLGILGLMVLFALQITFWRGSLAAWKRWRSVDIMLASLAVGAMGSMVDFLAHGLVDNSYFVVDLAYIFCFTLALVMKLNCTEQELADSSTQS